MIEWLQQGGNYVIELVAIFTALGVAAGWFYKGYHKGVREPINRSSGRLEKRIQIIEDTQENHEKRLTHVEKCLDNDNKSINGLEHTCKDIQRANAVNLRTQMKLLNIKLKEADDPETREDIEQGLDEIHEYLLERL